MRQIESMIGRELQWVQPSIFRRIYELRAGDILVARIRWLRFFSQAAEAESGDGCWTFNSLGIWRSRIVVRTCSDETVIGSFPEKQLSRKLLLPLSGGTTVVMKTDFWGWTSILTTETGDLLAQVKRRGLLKATYEVELRRKGTAYPEYPWLVMLLWYVALLARRRSHAVQHAGAG